MNKHLRSSLSGLFNQGVAVVIGLIVTPILLSTLGAQLYGVWALLWVLASYEALSDFGITTALINFLSGNEQTEDKNQLITTGLVVNTALTFIVVLVLFAAKDLILQFFFKVSGEERAVTEQAFTITLLTFLLLVIARTLAAVLDGLQRVDIRFAVQSGVLLCWAILVYFVLANGYGLLGVVVVTFVVGLVRVIGLAAATIWVYPAFRFRFGIDRNKLSRLAGYGLRFQGANVGQKLSEPLLKGFVATIGSAVTVGAIQIGNSVGSLPNSVVFSAIAILFPAISERRGQNDREGITNLVARYLLYVICFILPVSNFILVTAPQLVNIWLGDSYPLIVFSIRALIIAYFFRTLAMVPWRVQLGMDQPQHNSMAMLIHIGLLILGGAVLLLLSRSLIDVILIIYVASYAASSVYLIWRMHKSLPRLFTRDSRWLKWPLFWVVIISATLCLMLPAMRTQIAGELAFLLGSFLALLISYALIFFTAIPSSDRAEIKNHVVSLFREAIRSSGQLRIQKSNPARERTK